MAGKIIMWIVTFGCAILFFSIGVYAMKLKKPMWFWSGSEVNPLEISNIKKYNRENGIIPQTIKKDVRDVIEISSKEEKHDGSIKKLTSRQKKDLITKLEKEMHAAAKILDFEYAAYLRDRISKIRGEN